MIHGFGTRVREREREGREGGRGGDADKCLYDDSNILRIDRGEESRRTQPNNIGKYFDKDENARSGKRGNVSAALNSSLSQAQAQLEPAHALARGLVPPLQLARSKCAR